MENNELFRSKILLNTLKHWVKDYSYSRLVKTVFDSGEYRCGPWSAMVAAALNAREDHSLGGIFYYNEAIATEELVKQMITDLEALIGQKEIEVSATVKALSELMDLSRTEELMLQITNLSQTVPYHARTIFTNIQELSIFRDDRVKLYSSILGCTVKEAKTALNGFLFKTGILKDDDLFLSVADEFATIFDLGCETMAEIEEALFPQNISTNLTAKDFSYLANPLNRTGSIIKSGLEKNTKGLNFLFWGPPGNGKTELAMAIAKQYGFKLKSIGDISEKDTAEKSRNMRLSNLKIALKLYRDEKDVVLLFDEMEDLFKSDTNANFSKAFINRIIETTPIPIIWTTNSLIRLGNAVLRRMTYNIECKVPSAEARRMIWKRYAKEYSVKLSKNTMTMLDSFDISPALIKNTMQIAGAALSEKEQSDEFLKDIILSLDTLVQYGAKRTFEQPSAKELRYDVSCANTDHDMKVFTDRLVNAKSHAFSLCLYGRPGTGKSEYARYLARQMGKKVLFKRASDLISKWVGETEQLIAAAFKEAKEDQKVLIIDEGDSFLRNRENARASWEVSQVNEMLSQMETHTQPFIITTNLMDNLDAASLRRFAFKMQFNYLKPEQSKKLFKSFFGMKAPTEIEKMPLLVPGDFANVKTQVDILGIEDPNEIMKMLQNEIDAKPEGKVRRIGF